MKRFAIFLAVALMALALNVLLSGRAAARMEYKTKFEEMTKDSKAADAIKEAKCTICHYGTSKKNRNDFGKALNKHMNKDTYMSLKEDKEVLAKKVEEALKAALKEKSKDGKTFGQIIEGGSLPAKNPAE